MLKNAQEQSNSCIAHRYVCSLGYLFIIASVYKLAVKGLVDLHTTVVF